MSCERKRKIIQIRGWVVDCWQRRVIACERKRIRLVLKACAIGQGGSSERICNVTDTVSWQGHHDRVMQLNKLYFFGICQLLNYRILCSNSSPACNCDPNGSSSQVCDYVTGQCPCRANVAMLGQNSTASLSTDRQCQYCLVNFYGITSGQGCQPCGCSSIGQSSSQCLENGTCVCSPTVGGVKCDQCLPGYYGLSTSGCMWVLYSCFEIYQLTV